MVVILVYIRHPSCDGVNELFKALAFALDIAPLVFVGMDTNGHSPLWGTRGYKVDRVGGMIEDALNKGGLFILNSQNSPLTFCSDMGHKSWIDVSVVSPTLIHNIAEWAV